MQSFAFHLPTKLVFGPGELNKLGREAKPIGNKPIIVTGKSSARRSGLLDRVTALLTKAGMAPVVFAEVEPNPRAATIDRAGVLAREQGCDFVIGLGGGSPMDAAKGVATVTAEGGQVWDYVFHGQPRPRPIGKALPILQIPTLAATGSEGNSGAVITNWDTHEKAVLGHPLLYPRVSILDPELTLTVPHDYTVDGGIDIICHVIEGFFTGVEETPLQDRWSLAIVRTVMDYLPRVIAKPDDLNARTQLMWCSTMALCHIVQVGRGDAWPLHVIEHALSGHYDISHGRGLALVLPRVMELTLPHRPEKFALMARELFGSRSDGGDAGREALDSMIRFLDSVGRYLTMADVGVADDSRFGQMAEDTVRIYGTREGFVANPKPLYKEDIVEVFRMCTVKRSV